MMPKKHQAFFNSDMLEMRARIAARVAHKPDYVAIIEATAAYLTDTSRGHYYTKSKFITVPVWAFITKKVGYFDWYTAHEFAHAITGSRGHGPAFQAVLQELTPYAHWELGYKPRLAYAAGIRQPINQE